MFEILSLPLLKTSIGKKFLPKVLKLFVGKFDKAYSYFLSERPERK